MHIIPFKSFWVIVISYCLIRSVLWVYHGGMECIPTSCKIAGIITIVIGFFGFDSMSLKMLNKIWGKENNEFIFGILTVMFFVSGGIAVWDPKNNKTKNMSKKEKIKYLIMDFIATIIAIYMFFLQ